MALSMITQPHRSASILRLAVRPATVSKLHCALISFTIMTDFRFRCFRRHPIPVSTFQVQVRRFEPQNRSSPRARAKSTGQLQPMGTGLHIHQEYTVRPITGSPSNLTQPYSKNHQQGDISISNIEAGAAPVPAEIVM